MTILNLIFLNFFIILISYLFGSIPSGYILTKYFSKIDITKEGSGNIGATNVLRSGSKRLAIFTLLLDASKGIIPIIIFYNSTFSLILAGLSSFIGHNYPIWLKFNGGKGIATYLGISFAVSLKLGLIFILIWLITALISKTSSISSLLTIFLIPFISLLILDDKLISLLFLILTSIAFYRHRSNIKRIINGNEPKISIK
ncbi:MAG: glycerol-3-phosphate 1-O-acyltransferase PlsY [Hyphomicrobiales bacterium]|nr:glycerol-3-phosphate 1-O-acyltransferase PlsY [Pseudomonadota bacterium]MEC7961217.1 glycerol-3-phosphate 1-O-acyltransferase PlsY [Pseudomonadota bacterium]MEC8797301.1 glycerol-3-phosphate 1-O-acyltransferase PlsY [Pseudomonadota bacterium]|tara:strand:+ start:183 stop:782 length:600 start_codon:yes stop_codon:yes gene_type:complete